MRRDWQALVGYVDPLSAGPGETISCMVSSTEAYTLEIVRLAPSGTLAQPPGFPQRLSPGAHAIRKGSYMTASGCLSICATDMIGVSALVWPTLPERGPQCLVAAMDELGRRQIRLILAGNVITVLVNDGDDEWRACVEGVASSKRWRRVSGEWRIEQGELRVEVADRHGRTISATTQPTRPSVKTGFTLTAVSVGAIATKDTAPEEFFNGKIEAPRVFVRYRAGESVAIAWNFAEGIDTSRAIASIPEWHGSLVNRPTRGVRGSTYCNATASWKEHPEEYAAIHFHEDDLEDCSWPVAAKLAIPATWPSGLYAFRATSARHVDEVPFVVTGSAAGQRTRIAVLLSTLTYLAYANEQIDTLATVVSQQEDRYSYEAGLLSVYDRHSDGSGACYASTRKPLPTMRIGYRARYHGGPKCLSLDLKLLVALEDWGYEVDLLTDHDLHAWGDQALAGYEVLMTGSHPEYVTREIRESIARFVARGKNLMYLGGNGFYAVTTIDSENPHVLEIRRMPTVSAMWCNEASDMHHAMTGELGGTWRNRGLPEHELCGVGLAGVGFERGQPYRKADGIEESEWAFVFAGTSTAVFGRRGAVLGAAGAYEVDEYDPALGSPGCATRLASTEKLEGYSSVGDGGGESSAERRSPQADMVGVRSVSGGRVFAVGSIGWCGSLGEEPDDPVGRITRNVVRAFAGDSGDARTPEGCAP